MYHTIKHRDLKKFEEIMKLMILFTLQKKKKFRIHPYLFPLFLISEQLANSFHSNL